MATHIGLRPNARLFEDLDSALAPMIIIDGKHLW